MGFIQVYNSNLKHVATKDRKEGIMAKVTSKTVATKASKALQDGRSSDRTKSIAGSALSQREKKK